MIVAEGKPIEKILEMIAPYKKVLIAGCRGCVTVCLTGGEKEVGVLASQVRMARSKDGAPIEVLEQTEERQCDAEYNAKFLENVEKVDAIVSLACGIGIQFLGEKYPGTPIYPGVNTLMLGANVDVGRWEERCFSLWRLRPGQDRRHLPDYPLLQEPVERALRRFPVWQVRGFQGYPLRLATDL